VIQIEKFAQDSAANSGEFLDHHTSRFPPDPGAMIKLLFRTSFVEPVMRSGLAQAVANESRAMPLFSKASILIPKNRELKYPLKNQYAFIKKFSGNLSRGAEHAEYPTS
jgi:hypothetical protein